MFRAYQDVCRLLIDLLPSLLCNVRMLVEKNNVNIGKTGFEAVTRGRGGNNDGMVGQMDSLRLYQHAEGICG